MKSTKTTAAAKFGKAKNSEIDPKILRAVELKKIIDDAKREYDEIKQWFSINIFKDGKSKQLLATAVGTVTQEVTNSYSVLADKMPVLKSLFKRNLKDFVTKKTTYGCTAKLRELLKDGDYEHSNIVRSAVIIKTSPSIDFVGVESNSATVSRTNRKSV